MNIIRRAQSITGAFCATVLLASGAGAIAPGAAARIPAADTFTPTLSYYTCPPKSKPTGVRCAWLTVPLDWQTPNDGRTTRIDVRVMRAPGGNGGLTFNPGGPGGSGIEALPAFYSLLPDSVASQMDFVAWDPRGVGASGPKVTGCSYPEPLPPATGPVDWNAFWQETAKTYASSSSACVAANPESAPYVGTWQVIRDLDALRAALGYSVWNYWGMSYGTRIGYAYASTFPKRLRALIMDGSVMADETIYRFGTSFPANYWISRQLYPALAAPSAPRKIAVIEAYLNDKVLTLPDGKEFTRWDFAEQFRFLLSSQSQYPTARALVNFLYRGITASAPADREKSLTVVAEIFTYLRTITEQSKKGAPIQVLVNCSDFHDRPTVEELAAASDPVSRNYGVTAPAFMGNTASCFGLAPEKLSPAVPRAPGALALKTPPVFVLSSGDAATPWVWGRSLANEFIGSSTITYEGTQHVAYLVVPSDCVNDPVTRYLMTLERPAKNVNCTFSPGSSAPRR